MSQLDPGLMHPDEAGLFFTEQQSQTEPPGRGEHQTQPVSEPRAPPFYTSSEQPRGFIYQAGK